MIKQFFKEYHRRLEKISKKRGTIKTGIWLTILYTVIPLFVMDFYVVLFYIWTNWGYNRYIFTLSFITGIIASHIIVYKHIYRMFK